MEFWANFWGGLLLVGLLGFAALALLLFSFRGLLDYDPYAHVRHGSSELEDWFFRPSGSSPLLITLSPSLSFSLMSFS